MLIHNPGLHRLLHGKHHRPPTLLRARSPRLRFRLRLHARLLLCRGLLLHGIEILSHLGEQEEG